MNWAERIENYDRVTGFPRSLFIAGDGRVVGTFIMGNNYRVKSTYYGGYPAGYLRRMRALFPDKNSALHLFSGRVDEEVWPGTTYDLNPDLDPDIVGRAEEIRESLLALHDIVLADPPYSAEDAEHYGAPMVNRNKVIQALAHGTLPGTHVVWLDQVLPMYRKTDWEMEAVIGMVKSTNHRFRVITIFRRR